jgi:hypothetical protein
MWRSSAYDPWLIVGQILLLTSTFYLGACAVLWFGNLFLGTEIDIAYVFSPAILDFHHTFGWPPVVAFLFTAPVLAVALMKVVGRAKKCLDFVLTTYAIHIIACTLFYGFPTNGEWWLVNAGAGTVAVFL